MQASTATAKTGFWKSGHWPTLLVSLLYFDFCFAIWVLNGAMSPFIAQDFGLSAAQKGFMVSVPIISGALIRLPLGFAAQYIGRRWAAMIEMGVICIALIYGWLLVDSYNEVLFMGVLLGIAGASFGVALSLGSGSYPPRYKGLAAAIAGAGNSGAAFALIFAPPLAEHFGGAAGGGWKIVYGLAVLPLLLPMALMLLFAKEPADREHQSFSTYMKLLVDRDAWIMSIIYIVTFGGYIGFSNSLATLFVDGFSVDKAAVGLFAAPIIFVASVTRVLGGWTADKIGGIRVLVFCFILAIVGVLIASAAATPSLKEAIDGVLPTISLMVIGMVIIFMALGAGNGATFQLVPLRFSAVTAVAMSFIGMMGGLGGFFPPNALGLSKQYLDNYSLGLLAFGALIGISLITMLAVQRKWTKSWVGKGGKARIHVEAEGPDTHAPVQVSPEKAGA